LGAVAPNSLFDKMNRMNKMKGQQIRRIERGRDLISSQIRAISEKAGSPLQ
jgi:hypothetical protein